MARRQKAIDNSLKRAERPEWVCPGWVGTVLGIVLACSFWGGLLWSMHWLFTTYPWQMLLVLVAMIGICMVGWGLLLFAAIMTKLLS